FVYVLAVDTGGRGLDLSKPSFGKLFNIDDGVGPATWAPVDNSNCVGIWAGMGAGSYDGSKVPAPPAEEQQVVSSSQPVAPVQSVAPVSSSLVVSTSAAVQQSTTKPPATSVQHTAPPVTIRSTEPPASSSSAPLVSHENINENTPASSSSSGSSSLSAGTGEGSAVSQENKSSSVVVNMAYELGATHEDSLSGVGHNAKDDLSSDASSSLGSSFAEESDLDAQSSSGAQTLAVPLAVLSMVLVALL
ncbi:hypothetical protein LPJ73_006125, partial [Coemansia sp. RSA 2703]